MANEPSHPPLPDLGGDRPVHSRDAALPDRPQFHGPMSDREWLAIEVRAGDVVSHEAPNPTKVRRMVAHLRRGGALPPIEIDTEWRRHWTQGPQGMVDIGTGFGLLDGHHRLAAHLAVQGPDATIGVVYAAQRLEVVVDAIHEVADQAGTNNAQPGVRMKP